MCHSCRPMPFVLFSLFAAQHTRENFRIFAPSLLVPSLFTMFYSKPNSSSSSVLLLVSSFESLSLLICLTVYFDFFFCFSFVAREMKSVSWEKSSSYLTETRKEERQKKPANVWFARSILTCCVSFFHKIHVSYVFLFAQNDKSAWTIFINFVLF